MRPLSRSEEAARLVATLFDQTTLFSTVKKGLGRLGYGLRALPTHPSGTTRLYDHQNGETLSFCLITGGRPNG